MPRRRAKGFIRPIDPYQRWESHNDVSSTWRRIKDCFTGRGPDIFVGHLRHDLPRRHTWSRWDEDRFRRSPPDFYASRHPDHRYDFRTRQYQRFEPGMWSNVEYYPDGRYPRPWMWRDHLRQTHVIGEPVHQYLHPGYDWWFGGE